MYSQQPIGIHDSSPKNDNDFYTELDITSDTIGLRPVGLYKRLETEDRTFYMVVAMT